MIERVLLDNQEYAIIIRDKHDAQGIEFLTDEEYSQQLAYMHHPTGKIIDAHVHNFEERTVVHTQEVLVIKKGVLRVDFYNMDRVYLESRMLYAGDIILLTFGGHGFEVVEEIEMVEIKQGPYLGERDKTRFSGISASEAKVKEGKNG